MNDIYVLQRRDTGELLAEGWVINWTRNISNARKVSHPEDVARLIKILTDYHGYERSNLVGKVVTVVEIREADNG